ncbi:MAG: sorbosone dehydrogenase [Caldithrix sp.]|nr:sorbosone dehydrogenase [Caldithrix sp.]
MDRTIIIEIGGIVFYIKNRIYYRTTFLLILTALTLSCNGQNASSNDNPGITVPPGFSVSVFADNLGRARHITVNDNGDVYVALRTPNQGGGIVALRDQNNDDKADVVQYFGKYSGTGIDIHNNHLYFASDTAVMRYAMTEGELIPEPQAQFIAGGFIAERQHAAKPFTFDDQGNIYVNVGAPANACQEQMRTPGSPGMDPCPLLERFGGIWRFDAAQTGQKQKVHGFHFATGIRHAVAIDWNPASGKLYIVQHGRDQLHQLFPELFTEKQNAELPAEEFFLVEEGANFGWPYCYYDQIQGKKVLAPEYGGDGQKIGRCGQFESPIMAFPGHWAPNDLLFYHGEGFPQKYKDGAFIAFHGSWNRAPLEQRGYNVVFVPFEGDKPAGDHEIFADGFTGKESISSPREARFRPMGLARGPDGALYISDSVKGRIWKITYAR